MAFSPSRLTDTDVIRAILHNEELRGAHQPEYPDVDIAELIPDDDELAKLDAAIEENSRDAAAAKSEAERRGYLENIDRIEAVRDALIEARAKGQGWPR